ncbi:helix-turn-helix domain-containing protein [Nocardia sp. CA-290969]|uniref:helix-turn-helix domain-containing protein n=1 Tax=Nocardia sp. CA-290969 TaxID=3239986 RepID=UPI003D92AABE
MSVTIGEKIRRIRRSSGLTQAELGALIHFTQPAVSHLEHDGPAAYDVRVLRRVATALQVPLTALLATDEEAELKRRQFFKAGMISTGATPAVDTEGRTCSAVAEHEKIGTSDVERIISSVNRLHELQLVAGGDRLCDLAANQSRYVQYLLDHGDYSEKVGATLARAGAEMMTVAGWIHYDAGRWENAKRYYADAAQAATATGDGVAAAHAWINACLLSYRDGSRPREGIKLAEAAQLAARREGGPKLRALAAIREAEAHGVIGDRFAMVAAVGRAHRAYESTRGRDPGYLAHLPEAQISGLTGLVFMRIGSHREATAYLHAAIAGTAAYPRETAAWQIRLAESYVQSGSIADACTLLTENFDSLGAVASTRLQAALHGIVSAIRPHSAVREVRELLGMWTARS